jgi:NAD(P)-dependent dehydrogenase (short-subunit alcohol dehydrogenase family)
MRQNNRRHRIIIITGANNGIGLAMAESLLQGGDFAAALDLFVNHLDPGNPNLLGCICDVRDPCQVKTTIDEIIHHWGRLDILINSACLALYTGFEERLMEDIRQEFEVNYYGYLNLISVVLPYMKKQGHGVIHNVSSAVGFTGMPGMIGYTSTKGAIEAMTRTLALEYAGKRIVFNVMHPPQTRTKSAAGYSVPPEIYQWNTISVKLPPACADGQADVNDGGAGTTKC